MRCSLLIMGLCFFCAQAMADDGGVVGEGGAIQLIGKHSSIRMVMETVDIVLLENDARVHCVFTFKNEGKATTVKMGFPELSSGDAAREIEKTKFCSFRSWVDGKPVRTTLVSGGQTGEEAYTAWHVKNVSFAAGQTRIVVDSYTGPYGGMSDGSSFFSYVLRTGGSWRGTIGQAIVNFDISKLPMWYKLQGWPAGSKRQKGRVTWAVSNLKPTGDISISIMPRFPILNDSPTWGGDCSPFYLRHSVPMGGIQFLRSVGVEEVEQTRRVYSIKYNDRILKLVARSKTATVNGKKIDLPRAPELDCYGRWALPIGSVVKALGGRSKLDRSTGQLYVWLR